MLQPSRRLWLKNSAALLAGISIAPSLVAEARQVRKNPSGIILLNSNENAYGPCEASKKAMIDALVNSNRYPDDAINSFKKQLATFWDVSTDNILLGAGSSEIIGLTSLMAAATKGNVVVGEPSYRVWNGQAEAFGLTMKRVPLNNEKIFDFGKMLSAIDSNTRMVYICNPNNPTGTFADDTALRNFVNECSKKVIVMVDEAYTEFSNLPSLKDIAVANPNVIVAKTFSKIYGLAGARVGYAIAHADTIKKLSDLQPWPDVNVSTASIAAASAALNDQAFVNSCRDKIKQSRESCYQTFSKLKLEYIPSGASFILFNIDKIGESFSKQMQAKNIYVQHREHFGGKWCRVSMGTTEEMKVFCETLESINT